MRIDELQEEIKLLKWWQAELKKAQLIEKEVQQKFDAQKHRVMNILEASDLDKFSHDGVLVFLAERLSVKIPQNTSEREEFFTYLKEQGVYDDLITVNSQTINAFYKSQAELAESQGNLDFKIPGLNYVTRNTELRIRSDKSEKE